MKNALILIAGNIVSLASVICACYLYAHDKSAGGWFLLIAVIAYTTISYETKGKDDKNEPK